MYSKKVINAGIPIEIAWASGSEYMPSPIEIKKLAIREKINIAIGMQAIWINRNFFPCILIGTVEYGKTNFLYRKNAQINATVYERVADSIISKWGLKINLVKKFNKADNPPAIKKYINCFEKYNKRKRFIWSRLII